MILISNSLTASPSCPIFHREETAQANAFDFLPRDSVTIIYDYLLTSDMIHYSSNPLTQGLIFSLYHRKVLRSSIREIVRI